MERYAEKRLQLFDYQSKVTEQVKDDKHKVSGQGPYIICVEMCIRDRYRQIPEGRSKALCPCLDSLYMADSRRILSGEIYGDYI